MLPNFALQFTRQMVSRHRALYFRKRQRGALALRQRQLAGRFDRVLSSLNAATSAPIEASPHTYANGATALFFNGNWKGSDGILRVVIACNTTVPGTRRPAVAMVWTDDALEPVDFEKETLDSAIARGRLFFFASSISFPNGRAFTVLPAGFKEAEDGPPGFWSFATGGRYRGRAFVLGRGGAGTFVDPAEHALMVVRPLHFDRAQRRWIWVGRSSSQHEQRLRYLVDVPLGGRGAQMSFDLPPVAGRPNIAAVRCTGTDDRGDPIGVVDTRTRLPYGIVRIKGVLHFYARPQQSDQHGRPVFAIRAIQNEQGEPVIHVPFLEDRVETDVELPATNVMADGSQWFIRYPNVKDRVSQLPLVLIALRSA